jgi:hypothetical protein
MSTRSPSAKRDMFVPADIAETESPDTESRISDDREPVVAHVDPAVVVSGIDRILVVDREFPSGGSPHSGGREGVRPST